MTKCACDQPIQSLGLFSCNIYPGRIKRIIFTKRSRESYVSSNPNASGWALVFAGSPNPWVYEDNYVNSSSVGIIYYYNNSYRLFTPLVDGFESTREDDVREEVDGTQFFVRRGKRSLSAIFVQKNAELVKFYEELRCHNDLQAFLIDENGVAWGLRVRGAQNVFDIAGIPVVSATISSSMSFPTASTTQKITLNLTFDDFSDGDLIPIIDNNRHLGITGVDLMTYMTPVRISGTYDVSGGNLIVILYVPIATSAGTLSVPVTGQANRLRIYNGSTLLTNSFTEIQPGAYQTTNPTNWTHIVFNPTATYTENYDFYGFRLNR